MKKEVSKLQIESFSLLLTNEQYEETIVGDTDALKDLFNDLMQDRNKELGIYVARCLKQFKKENENPLISEVESNYTISNVSYHKKYEEDNKEWSIICKYSVTITTTWFEKDK